MPITPTEKVWMNGRLVDWADAKIHILTHTLHYGTGVFEGMRCYETPDGPAIFRLTDHMTRLHQSAKILMMPMPYSVAELVQAAKDTVRATGLPSCYVRPIAYYGFGEMGVSTLNCTVDVAIACWPWGAYLGEEALLKGAKMKVASWTRHDHNTMPPAAKTTGNYVNSSLAKVEAIKAGYDEAIMQPITLTEEQHEFRRVLRQFCDEKIAPLAASNDARAEYSWETFRALQSLELTALQLPAEYGGAGADLVTQALAVEELARADASASLTFLISKLGMTPSSS